MASTLSQVHNRPTILPPPSSFSQDICRAILASSQTPKYAHAFSNSQIIETPPPPPPSPVGFRTPSFLCEKNRTWRRWRVVHEVSVTAWTKIYKTKKNTDYLLRLITSTSYLCYVCLRLRAFAPFLDMMFASTSSVTSIIACWSTSSG